MRFSHAFIPTFVALSMLTSPSASNAQIAVGLSITVVPPVLPVYVQPAIPAPGYIWTPGYWAYGPDGYYWVPGTWVQPPTVGLLWTPGYWGFVDGAYVWHGGYWGPHIGFYGGVNYGFGYAGVGYAGGQWVNGVFSYNRTVNNFGSVNITNVYSKTVINNTTVTNVSFNGGAGGTTARPTPEEQAAAHEQHVAATSAQTQHEHAASTNHALLASVNHGSPAVAATSRAGEFTGHGVVGAKPGPNQPHNPTQNQANLPGGHGSQMQQQVAPSNQHPTNTQQMHGSTAQAPSNPGPHNVGRQAVQHPRPAGGPPPHAGQQKKPEHP